MTDPNSTPRANWFKPNWLKTGTGRVAAAIGGLAFVVALSFGAQAVAESRPVQHMKLLLAQGSASDVVPAHFGGGRAMGHGGRNRFANMSEADMDKLIARGVAHAAIEIEASDEQRDKITARMQELARKLRPVPDGFRDAGERMRELLLADTIDTAAVEAVRAERVAEADRVSREAVAAMVDVAQILTPEQRKTASERIETFRAMRKRFRRD